MDNWRYSLALILVFVLLQCGASAAWCAGTSLAAVAVVQEIRGSGDAMILHEQGKDLAKVGMSLRPGDQVVTGETNSVTIQYSDGTRLHVARESGFKLEQSELGTGFNELNRGEVRAEVTKTAVTQERPRFVIRTRAMVLGVRGTEFVVSREESGRVELHTLEGAVEVASDEPALLAGKGRGIAAGEAIAADSAGLRHPTKFNVETFRKLSSRRYLGIHRPRPRVRPKPPQGQRTHASPSAVPGKKTRKHKAGSDPR